MELESELENLRDPKWEPFMGCRAHATKYDAALAHALVKSWDEMGKEYAARDFGGAVAVSTLAELQRRAMRLMDEWGFDERARS